MRPGSCAAPCPPPSPQTLEPLILLGGLHMADITDLAWSCDGSWLGVASQVCASNKQVKSTITISITTC
jgi:hypothetical protein